MTTIISNPNFKIIKDSRSGTLYSINFDSNNEAIIKSIIKTRIILGATSTNNYSTLLLKASSIKTFKEFQEQNKIDTNSASLSYPTILRMIYDLAEQLNYLITTEHQTFLGYNPENIIVINDNKFIYLSNEYMMPINTKTENIQITYPFLKNDFYMSPELENIKEIPAKVHYKTTYFSFATLILYALTGSDTFLFEGEEESSYEKIHKYLDSLYIKDTQLYWLLKKALNKYPKLRTIQFI